ncbi:MAG: hypothetical protein ACI8WB_004763 [Phenylobacterium sp.]|jgi:hypothetical protein
MFDVILTEPEKAEQNKAERKAIAQTVKQIADATDALGSVTVPDGSIEETTVFLEN